MKYEHRKERGHVMKHLLISRFKGSTRLVAFCIVVLPLFWVACGHSSDSPSLTDPGIANPSVDIADLTPLELKILGDNYEGLLVVHLNESLGSRYSKANASLVSKSGDERVTAIQDLLSSYDSATLIPVVQTNYDTADFKRLELERISGKKIVDWNSVYYVDIADPSDAISLLRELKNVDGVEMAYPAIKPVITDAQLVTPSLTDLQDYLYDGPGGLNAQAMWNRGIEGSNVYLIDYEDGLNVAHEDLNLVASNYSSGGNYYYEPSCLPGIADCGAQVAHGTAVASILVGRNNDYGMRGFAPEAHYLYARSSRGTDRFPYDIINAVDGVDDPAVAWDDDVDPGSIWLIEVALGPTGSGTVAGAANPQQGSLPLEAIPAHFHAIEMASAYGVTVVAAAGNGSVSLDDPNIYYDPTLYNLSNRDSGSVLVGSSSGVGMAKIESSNCGSPVDLFAWGQGVVSAGYPYAGSLPWNSWNNELIPAPQNNQANKYYISNFGGTSSASAMIAGAAALVQSYVKDELGTRRFLMPAKMKEILAASGDPQTDGGCNIGRQPRLDVALDLVDNFLDEVRAEYPRLVNDEPLYEDEMIELRSSGLGIICYEGGEYPNHAPRVSDPSCPGTDEPQEGSQISKSYDFDGDRRGDIVEWSRSNWKIDLSGRGSSEDRFGAWDLDIPYEPIDSSMLVPSVADMNSDGMADFVIYDRENGKFYIAYTDQRTVRYSQWHGWDLVIDYSEVWTDQMMVDWRNSRYSRPALGDYNGDGWTDLAIACSDGFWRIDLGGGVSCRDNPDPSCIGAVDRQAFGGFEKTVKFLTDQQLLDAPGWAYPIVPGYYIGNKMYIAYKVPDGLPQAGKMFAFSSDDPNRQSDEMKFTVDTIFGGNDVVAIQGNFGSSRSVALYDLQGNWRVAKRQVLQYAIDQTVFPVSGFGGHLCHPMVADFDGDGFDDRAVMCSDGVKIAYWNRASYSDLLNAEGLRVLPLVFDEDEIFLPGRSYSGGISFSDTQMLIDFQLMKNSDLPPVISLDMVGGEF